jgi:hypothetical protein
MSYPAGVTRGKTCERALDGTPATAARNIVTASDAAVEFSEITDGCLMPT